MDIDGLTFTDVLLDQLDGEFWHLVSTNGDCWEWSGTRNDSGYGVFPIPFDDLVPRYWPNTELAHRVAFWMLGRRCPPGHHLHHLCRNKACVKPLHLVPMQPDEHFALHRRERQRQRIIKGAA